MLTSPHQTSSAESACRRRACLRGCDRSWCRSRRSARPSSRSRSGPRPEVLPGRGSQARDCAGYRSRIRAPRARSPAHHRPPGSCFLTGDNGSRHGRFRFREPCPAARFANSMRACLAGRGSDYEREKRHADDRSCRAQPLDGRRARLRARRGSGTGGVSRLSPAGAINGPCIKRPSGQRSSGRAGQGPPRRRLSQDKDCHTSPEAAELMEQSGYRQVYD